MYMYLQSDDVRMYVWYVHTQTHVYAHMYILGFRAILHMRMSGKVVECACAVRSRHALDDRLLTPHMPHKTLTASHTLHFRRVTWHTRRHMAHRH